MQVHTPAATLEHAAWDILEDERKVIPARLPETGISLEMEELLSSTFIQSPVYGTRCSNFLTLDDHHWHWREKFSKVSSRDRSPRSRLNDNNKKLAEASFYCMRV